MSPERLSEGLASGLEMSPMMDWNDNWGAGDWLTMSLMMLIFWGAVIGTVGWLILNYSRNRTDSHDTGASEADQVLAARYARGEIDEDEFNRRRTILHESSAGSLLDSDVGGGGRRQASDHQGP